MPEGSKLAEAMVFPSRQRLNQQQAAAPEQVARVTRTAFSSAVKTDVPNQYDAITPQKFAGNPDGQLYVVLL